jgi:hypothetical protein
MKKTFCIPAFIFMFISTIVYGQDSVMTVSENKYVHLDFGLGYLKTDLHSINKSLTNFAYKPVKEDFLTLSISSGFVINRVLVRNELSIMLPNSTKQGNHVTTTFRGYSIGVGIGYEVIKRPTFRLYPFIGINSFVNRLEFEDDAPVENMDGVINTPRHSTRLYFSNASFDAGVQFEKLIERKHRKWDCPQNRKFMSLGIRAGYHFGPGAVKARYNGKNQPIADAPSYALKGPYVKLTYGLGSKMRELKWKK